MLLSSKITISQDDPQRYVVREPTSASKAMEFEEVEMGGTDEFGHLLPGCRFQHCAL